jgi:hypothetical protein
VRPTIPLSAVEFRCVTCGWENEGGLLPSESRVPPALARRRDSEPLAGYGAYRTAAGSPIARVS